MTGHYTSWIELARKQAARFQDKPAYRFLEDGDQVSQTITYKEMDMRVRALAARLQKICCPDDRVLLVYGSSIENMIAFFACLYAGLIAVPVAPPHRGSHNTRLENIIIDCDTRLALSTARELSTLQRRFGNNPLLEQFTWLASDTIDPDEAHDWNEPYSSHDTLAFLQYTSGSTGTPKGVSVSHGNLLYNQAMMQSAWRTTEDSAIVSWLPIFHDMGLIGQALHAFYVGTTCTFMPPMSFLQQPLRWLKAISTYRAEISGGPNFSYTLCEKKISQADLAGLDLSSWRVALNGAEPVQYSSIEGFSRRFADCGFKKSAFYPGYGMAEATLIISGAAPDALPVYRWVDKEALAKDQIIPKPSSGPSVLPLVGCGGPLLDESIVVVDANSWPCPDNRTGEIWVAGKHVARGYWSRPEETQHTFHAYLSDGRGPFLRTGDLGFLNDGNLFITGRLNDLIILQGSKYYPQDLEASIHAAVPGVRPHGVAAFRVSSTAGERAVVAAEVERELLHKTDLRQLANSIRQVVFDDHGIALLDIVLITPGTLPKTTSGKIQRNVCGDLYLSGGFRVCQQHSSHQEIMSIAG